MTQRTCFSARRLALAFTLPAIAQEADHSGHQGMTMRRAGQGRPERAPARPSSRPMRRCTGMDIDFTGNADVDFVRGMIAHHQGAIDMAKVELEYGKDDAIRTLAAGGHHRAGRRDQDDGSLARQERQVKHEGPPLAGGPFRSSLRFSQNPPSGKTALSLPDLALFPCHPPGRRGLDKRRRDDAGHQQARFAKFGIAAAAGGPDQAKTFPEHDFLSLARRPSLQDEIRRSQVRSAPCVPHAKSFSTKRHATTTHSARRPQNSRCMNLPLKSKLHDSL
jgi:hypothetical protein